MANALRIWVEKHSDSRAQVKWSASEKVPSSKGRNPTRPQWLERVLVVMWVWVSCVCVSQVTE